MKPFIGYAGSLKNLLISNSEIHNLFGKNMFTFPKLYLNQRQLCDLELLLNGGFSPLEGFMDEENYLSVLAKMRLKNNILWPIPITLDIHDIKKYRSGSSILLCDPYGKFLAVLKVSSVYRPDKRMEAKSIYGTTNKDHFGVNYLIHRIGNYYLGGKIYGLATVERNDFKELRHTPLELQSFFEKNGWKNIVGFQTRNPLHKAHFSLLEMVHKEYLSKILIHPAVGLTKDNDIDYVTRVRCYIKFHNLYTKKFTKISLLPLSMRMAGPKEAVWHAIIRKNYGCTHFIVGRDHAGPGKSSSRMPFYGTYEAQQLAQKYEEEIGIKILPIKEIIYLEKDKKYVQITQVKKGQKIKTISGTQLRQMLSSGTKIPEWFSFPEIIKELKRSFLKQQIRGLTIFFTGLSSSGKSTTAQLLYFKLLELTDKKATLLDGDIVRQNLSKGLGFSKEDRNINIRRIGFVANEITKHGGIAICAAIAPYKETREENRKLISQNGTYIEVYVATPLRVCKERDTKSLYKKSALGIIKGLTGVDDPYEPPKNPEIIIDTTDKTPLECVSKILSYLKTKNLITIHPLRNRI